MTPAASVSGLYLAHPEARYFNLGKIGKDQVEDYAQRMDVPLAEVERWLGSNLGYTTLERGPLPSDPTRARRQPASAAARGQNLTDEPQPQLPVTCGLLNLKPEPWTPST